MTEKGCKNLTVMEGFDVKIKVKKKLLWNDSSKKIVLSFNFNVYVFTYIMKTWWQTFLLHSLTFEFNKSKWKSYDDS